MNETQTGPARPAQITNLLHTAIRYHQAGDLHRAEEVYREILRLDPQHADALQFLGLVYRSSNPAVATQLVRRSLEINPASPSAHFNLGMLLHQAADQAGARAAYEAALARKPDYFEALFNLGVLLNDTRHHELAAQHLGRALRLRPRDAGALSALGVAREGMGDLDAAVQAYEAAIAENPAMAGAHANLAAVLDRRQQLEAARASCARALALDPRNPVIVALAAQLDLRAGDADAALARVDDSAVAGFPPQHAAAALTVRGRALERRGEYDAAFAAYAAANAATRATPAAARLRAADTALAEAGRLAGWYDPGRVAGWPAAAADDGVDAPAFLVGFPRSGTTLLSQILFAHGGAAVLEERDAFNLIANPVLNAPQGLAAADTLTPQAIGAARRRYQARAAELAGPLEGRLLVDKYPLHIALLPLVHRFFPGARVVVALRDPRDVCLSCFAQNFVLNKAMAHFLDLADTARFYAAVMGLWLRYRDTLPLSMHVVRYEELVAGFEPVVRGVLDHLGLPWREDVTRFHDSAGRRAIGAPSYEQVARPLHGESVARWRRFERHLEPVRATLAPLVAALGYDA